MAITSGVGPHAAWLNVNGGSFPIEHGSVSQSAKRKSSSFSVTVPLSFPGAQAALASLGDNTATITVLARGQVATLLTGEVDQTDFDYIHRTIRVHGRDKSAKLHEQKTAEKWLNKKPSEIVQDLVGRVGLSGKVTASMVSAGKKLEQDFVKLSDNHTFSHIINKMAHLDAARWWVDPQGTFHYVPIGSQQGIYSIFISQDSQPIASDCLALKVHRNVRAGKSIQVTVKAWHPRKKQIFQYQSNVDGVGGPIPYVYHVPTIENDLVRQHAQSEAIEKARHELTVHATVVGDPTVQAGMGLQLSGTHFFDQVFEIDTVHHEFGMSGYRTSITARSAKQGRSAS